jgi:hypothetical protein
MSTDQPAGLSEPRRALPVALGVCAIATLLLAYPALGGGFLVNPRSDQFIAGYAFREFAAESLRSGNGFPMWNPYLFGGMPYVAAMHGDIFYPTFLLRMVLPTDVAMTWGFIIHLFFCGAFTYLFLRRIGIGFAPSVIGAIAYMLSGQIASLVSPGHDGKLFVNALFPLTLLLLHHGIRGARPWAWGALAVTVGLAVLSPHPQLLQYMLLASGVYALYLAYFGPPEQRLPRGDATARLGIALVAVALGMVMGAVQYLPVLNYVPWSPRSGGMLGGYEHAVSYSMPPMELINTVVPEFTGILDNYWGVNGIHLHSEYLGIVTLILASAAFGSEGVRRRRVVAFWTIMFAVSVLWALGGNTGFYRLVYAMVPGTKYFRAPSTIFYVSAFAVAVLAALGAERLLAREVSRRFLAGWGIFLGLLLLLGVSGGLSNMAQSFAPPGRYEFAAANADALRLGVLRVVVFGSAALALLWAVGEGRIRGLAAGLSLAALALADLWSVDRRYWQFSPPAARLFASDPVVDYLRRLPQPARVLTWPSETTGRDPFLTGDALMSHDVRQMLGYHGNQLGRYDELLGGRGSYQQVVNPNVWRLTNVRYFMSTLPTPPLNGARLVAGPARNAFGTMVYLHELPMDNPFAWVTPAIVRAPDEQVLPTLHDPRFDVRTVALFDTSARVTAQQLSALPEPLDLRTTVRQYAPGRISLALDAPAPAGSALVVSENYYPGWRARVDGREVPVGRVDYVLLGLELPAGARQVELTFDDPAFHRGRAVTLGAVAVALLLLVGGIAWDRRRLSASG